MRVKNIILAFNESKIIRTLSLSLGGIISLSTYLYNSFRTKHKRSTKLVSHETVSDSTIFVSYQKKCCNIISDSSNVVLYPFSYWLLYQIHSWTKLTSIYLELEAHYWKFSHVSLDTASFQETSIHFFSFLIDFKVRTEFVTYNRLLKSRYIMHLLNIYIFQRNK